MMIAFGIVPPQVFYKLYKMKMMKRALHIRKEENKKTQLDVQTGKVVREGFRQLCNFSV